MLRETLVGKSQGCIIWADNGGVGPPFDHVSEKTQGLCGPTASEAHEAIGI